MKKTVKHSWETVQDVVLPPGIVNALHGTCCKYGYHLTLAAVKACIVNYSLSLNKGNKTDSANSLGMKRNTLSSICKELLGHKVEKKAEGMSKRYE